MCFELRAKIPDATVLLDMEPEELAGALLPILKKRNTSQDINLHNFLMEFQQPYHQPFPRGEESLLYPRQDLPKIEKVVMEAVGWMLSVGLLARSPGAHGA